jgi:autotransporter translocation and assembly factor TamB
MRTLMRVIRRIAIAIGVVFIAAVVFLLYSLKTGDAAEWVRQGVLSELHLACGVEAKFDSFTFDAFPPEVTMSGLEMQHLDGRPIISVDEAILSLQVLPLFARRIQLDRVAVLEPSATIVLQDGRILNLPSCVEPKEDQKKVGVPIALGIRELTIERGTFDLAVDQIFRAKLNGIDIALEPRKSGSGSSVRLAVDASTLVIDGRELPLHRMRMLGHLEGLLTSPRAIVLERLEAFVGKVEASGTGSIDLFGPVYEAKLGVQAPLAAIHDFLPDFPETAGEVDLDVSLSGTFLAPRAAGKITIDGGRIAEYKLADRVSLDLSADDKAIEISAIDIRLADGSVTGKAHIELDKNLSVKAELGVDSISMGRALDSAGVLGAWVDYRVKGKVTAAGTLLEPTQIGADFNFEVRDLIVTDGAFDAPGDQATLLKPGQIAVTGHAEIDDGGVSFTEATVSSGETIAHVVARINADSNLGINVKVSFPAFDFEDIGGMIASIPFTGRGTIEGELFGPYDNIQATGSFAIDDSAVVAIPFGYVRGKLAWHDDSYIDLTEMTGVLGESSYTGSLSVKIEDEVPFIIKGALGEGRLQDLLLPFGLKGEDWGDPRGKITEGVFDLKGPITHLSGPIDLSIRDASIVDEKFESGRAVGRFENGVIVLEEAELDKHGATVTAKGRLDPNGGGVKARLSTRDLTLQKLDVLKTSQPKLDGKLALKMAIEGTLENGVTGTAVATFTELTAGVMTLPPGQLNGTIKGKLMEVKGALLGEALGVDGEIELAAKLPYRAALTLTKVDMPRMVGSLGEAPHWTGNVDAKVKLNGTLVDWPVSNGEIALENALFDIGAVRLETAAFARLELDEGVLSTKKLVLAGEKTRLTASGKIGAPVIDLDIVGRIDLALLEAWSPSVERAAGTLSIDSAIEGVPGNVNLVGTGKVSGGVLQWRGFDERLSAVSADLTFSQSTILIDRAEGRWAEGRVSASGSVVLDEYNVRNMAIAVLVDDVRPKLTYPTVDVSGEVNGTINVEGPPTHFFVRGELDVERGRARPKVEVTSVAGDRGRVQVNVYDPSQEIMELDLGIHVVDTLRVKNDSIDLEVNGDVRLTGTNQRFGFLGTVNVLRGGRVTLFSRVYEFQSGVIEFQDRYRFYPRYDLTLRSDACAAQITLNIVGTLDESPSPAYSSNPDMDEENIVSCLVRGVRVQELDSDLARFASGALWKVSGLDREVKKVLPVDEIDLTTEYSSQTRAYEPRVLVAKELTLLGGSARLEYSSSLSQSKDQEVRLRYRITPRLTLQGGWVDSNDVEPVVGDLGLDLKYRWEW